MAEILLTRTLNGFGFADEHARELAKKFVIGQNYKADVRRTRSRKSLSRYWVLVKMILDNTDQFTSRDQLHDYLKIRAGHCTPIVAKSSGEIFLIAKSIDFDTLDEQAFQEVWQRVIDVVVQDILPGITQAEIENEIHRLIGCAR